jgi:hypothetical protein
MRTTLTLDDDNAVRLERLRKHRDASLKETVNDVIRRGLDTVEAPAKKRVPFKLKPVDLGEPLFNSAAELKELIARLDEEEDLRKLGLK